MTAGDIISVVYTQVQRSKKTGVTVDAGKFGNFNTDDPQVIIQSPASETKPCFSSVSKEMDLSVKTLEVSCSQYVASLKPVKAGSKTA